MSVQGDLFTSVTNSAVNYGRGNAKAMSAQKSQTTSLERRKKYTPQELMAMYSNSPLAQNMIDMPASDALAKWRNWLGNPLQNAQIESEERRLGLKAKLLEAYSNARLNRGCTILIVTEEEDYSTPLDPTKLAKGGIVGLSIIPMDDYRDIQIQPSRGTANYGEAIMFYLQSYEVRKNDNTFVASIDRIHPSRLIVLPGKRRLLNRGIVNKENYRGDSFLQARIPGIVALESIYNNIEFMVYEARTPVLSLGDAVTAGADSENPELAAQVVADTHVLLDNIAEFKGIHDMMVIDKETMEYKVHNNNFGGLPPIVQDFTSRVAQEANIPATILLGKSPDGMNSTGAADFKQYYNRLRGDQELILQPAMQIFDQALVRSALGLVNSDITYEWNPLEEVDELEMAQIFGIHADRITKLMENGTLSEVQGNAAIEKILIASGLG